ncbi:hypothetical protein Q5P01_005523 [Channa striata]|uniref:Prostaglandin E2 receptor EP2 subtype n=1 Tax=Channa striata TaxID=64152 RepID=A0AA88NHT8_CHASR|nr:hypothetical protein Q5P01_005523 [Channa striata]
MESRDERCNDSLYIDSTNTRSASAVMFALGIFGNVAALVILEIQRRRDTRNGGTWRRALFHILIKALVITDLTGTCLVTPVVQLSYSRNITFVGMSKGGSVCKYFGVSMTFFSLATIALLFTMALERCFAIGYPYLYSRHVTKKCAYITIPLVYLLCAFFCLLPFAGFGEYVQYCPGTWCFINMNPDKQEDKAYAILYATVTLVLVLAIVVCNGFVVYQLFRMYQRRRKNGGSMTATMRSNNDRRAMSLAEEVEHLILLVFMTIIFIICTLPLVIRVYMNHINPKEKSHSTDLFALRFISFNPIINPFVFIILSPSVLHFYWASLCGAPLRTSRGYMFKPSIGTENSRANTELPRPSLDYIEHFHSVENL